WRRTPPPYPPPQGGGGITATSICERIGAVFVGFVLPTFRRCRARPSARPPLPGRCPWPVRPLGPFAPGAWQNDGNVARTTRQAARGDSRRHRPRRPFR